MSPVLKEKIAKAEILVEALPYIRKFRGQTFVIKYGGSVMEDGELKRQVASDLILLSYVGIKPIVVHGGGKEISRWAEKIGKDPVFIDGLRFTDLETMEITEMVLSGKINSEIVSLINQEGGNAVGLSGKDAHLLTAKKIRTKDDKDLGSVGEIVSVNADIIENLKSGGYIPVISSVGVCKDGESLNLNADNAASQIAIALQAQKLIYLTDAPGILINKELVTTLSINETEELKKHPDVKGGMLPKISYSLDALKAGVKDVHIIDGNIAHAILLEVFTDRGIGTHLSEQFAEE